MIHEHEALELASAAIDFGLGPEVERELTLTYRDCPVCAERAASYHEQIRMMRRLPVLDASEATRQRVTAAALGGRAGGRSTLVLVLAAALLVALLLGLTAAAGALLRNRPPEDLLGVGPSPSGATTSPPGSAAPGSQDPATAGGGVFADKLPADSIAQVVETNVRVRSEPRVSADSTKLEPFLQPGDRLFVVEGPVVADDYDWYRVVPIGTNPGRPGSSLPTGWVSRGDHDATPWIEPGSADCPQAPVDIARLGEMHPLERLACSEARRCPTGRSWRVGPTVDGPPRRPLVPPSKRRSRASRSSFAPHPRPLICRIAGPRCSGAPSTIRDAGSTAVKTSSMRSTVERRSSSPTRRWIRPISKRVPSR